MSKRDYVTSQMINIISYYKAYTHLSRPRFFFLFLRCHCWYNQAIIVGLGQVANTCICLCV